MSVINKKGQRLREDILRFLYYKKALSIAELSKLTGRSVPLVTANVNLLINEGYIIEKGLAPSTGGRRPQIFLNNPNKPIYIVAVAMDQLITRLMVYNMAGEAVAPLQRLELDVYNDKDALSRLISFIKLHIEKQDFSLNQIIGVGIGMPGFVSAEKGINATHLPTPDGSTVRDYLARQLGLPVYIDNDSSLIAIAELQFGNAIQTRNALVVNVGWGTGLGIIIGGKLYRGSSGFAGEFSHISFSNSEELCPCGKRGCLEVDSSLRVMANKAREAVIAGQSSSLEELLKDSTKHYGDHFLDAVVKDDPLAVSIFSNASFQIGRGLAMLIHILNPEYIVLSGRGARAGKTIVPVIQKAIQEFCIPRIAQKTTIVLSTLAENAELLAAASLVVEQTKLE